MGKTIDNVTECVGHTPLVRLARFYPPHDGIELYAKLEYLNPGGSVKDRVGLAMIQDAERRGRLRPGGTVVEATAGNTGIGLALTAAVRGYRCVFVVPERFSQEKQALMRALGAEIVSTPTAAGMEGAMLRAAELAAQIPGAVLLQQFANQANVEAHYAGTGPEIWEQLEGRVDVAVIGAGTGGTFTGVVRFLREHNPHLYAVIVQPYGASLGQPPHRPHKTEGIGIDRLETARILDQGLIDRVLAVTDEEAHSALLELVRQEAILAGSSSGAAACAARIIAQEISAGALVTSGGRIVTIFPDGGDRYLSKNIYGSFAEWRA